MLEQITLRWNASLFSLGVGATGRSPLPARKRPRWPLSQEGSHPPSLPGRLMQALVLPDVRGLEGCRLMRLGPIAANADINAERNVERHHPFHALANQGPYPLKLRVRHLEQ